MAEGVRIARIPGAKTFVWAKDSDTIAGVKARIQETDGTPVEHQCLIFEGRSLDNCETLEACGASVSKRPTLHLITRPAGGSASPLSPRAPSSAGIRIRFVGDRVPNEGFILAASPQDTPGVVKAKLDDRLGIPSSRQRLIFEGLELCDANSLGSQGVNTEKVPKVHVVVRAPNASEDSGPRICEGGHVERIIDGVWFRAEVLSLRGEGSADLRYLDDGNVEKGVPLHECRVCS